MSKRLAGTLAILAGLTALLITLPFALAFSRAYEPGIHPARLYSLVRTIPGLFNFAIPESVYQMYGRIYSFVIPLTIPAVLMLKKQVGIPTRLSRWGWGIFFGGTLVCGLGIFGDYWTDPKTSWYIVGFMFELAGMLVMWVGAILYGLATLRADRAPRGVGFALLGIPPVGIIGFLLFSHIPSGPLLGYVIFWLGMGLYFLQGVDQ